MAHTININIRMDAELKHQFEAFCADMGMSMSTAFNLFAKKAVREYRIPFEIGASRPNEETRQITKNAKNGEGLCRSFSTASKPMEGLHDDDSV